MTRKKPKHIGGYDFEVAKSEGFGTLAYRKAAGALYRSLKDLHPDPVNLTSGDPKVLSFADALKAGQKFLKKRRKGDEPGYPSGPEFTDEQAEDLLAFLRSQGIKYKSEKNLLPLAGVTNGLALAMQALYDYETAAIVIDTPNYGLSLESTDLIRGELYTTPLNSNGSINLERIEKMFQHLRKEIPDRKIMYYLSSPHNPTGDVVPGKTLKRIAALMGKYDIGCFHDVAYWGLQHSDEKVPMLATYAPERTITGFTCSKLFGMPDQRAGFICGPNQIMEKLTHDTFVAVFSVSSVQKTVAAKSFSMAPEILEKREELIKERREYYFTQGKVLFALVNGLDSITDKDDKEAVSKIVQKATRNTEKTSKALKGLTEHGIKIDQFPNSGFFALLNVDSLIGTKYKGLEVQCAEHVAYIFMKEAGVLFLPGGAMLAEERPAVLRISFSTKPADMIKGLGRISNYLEQSQSKAKT